MNYRHIYHAGNFADIVKHISLIAILEQLGKKEKPFAVLDAFAGIGLYDLGSIEALKTGESAKGIRALQEIVGNETKCSSKEVPNLISTLLEIVNLVNKEHTKKIESEKTDKEEMVGVNIGDALRSVHMVREHKALSQSGAAIPELPSVYPGSPHIVKTLLRQHDRLIASELHPEDYLKLKSNLNNRSSDNIGVHHIDAYNAVKAFLPFKEGRGLVFLDPAFEVLDEFEKLAKTLQLIKKRATNITAIIWYPIKDEKQVQNFYRECNVINFSEVLIIEFELQNAAKNLSKCGLMIVNPPYIATELDATLDYLVTNIYPGQACYKMYFLR